MASEPDSSGLGSFEGKITSPSRLGKQKTSNISAQFDFSIPGLGQVQQELLGVSNALKELKSTLHSMSSSFTAGPIVNMLAEIRKEAAATSQSLNGLSSAVAGAAGAGSAGSHVGRASAAQASSMGNSTSQYAGMAAASSQSAGAAINSAGGGTASGSALGNLGTKLGSQIAKSTSIISSTPLVGGLLGAAADISMMPMRFTRERVQTNRAASLAMSQELTPYQWSTGGSNNMQDMLWNLKNFPGGMQGDVSDILNALTIGRRSGAQYGFGMQGAGGRYSNQFYQNVSDFQKITPGLGAGQIAQTVGNQLNNTQSQQAAAFYTGGAFSMVAAGGKGMKSASEWAEGILKWLQNQRPGKDRGKAFNYGELLGQNFPGSNINAWFDTVGVSGEMRDYWWSWALARVNQGGSGADVFKNMEKGGLESNQAWRRLSSQNALSRNEFGLAGQMSGAYATRERSNTWYNQAIGAATNRMIPAFANSPVGRVLAYLPDEIEDFVWNALESSGPLGQLVGGTTFNAQMLTGGAMQAAGIGDPGDMGAPYDQYGGRSTAGLNPDLRSKIARMMKANPRLSMTSGLRDSYTQAKLAKKGIGNFGSGSANIGSPHAGGWAADLGPRSEYGWLMKNAHKFGLETASKYGEPWHIQVAGTTVPARNPGGRGNIGDPGDVGNPFDWAVDQVGGAIGWGIDQGKKLPVVGTVFKGIDAFGDALQMLGKVLGTVFSSFSKMQELTTGGGLLDMSNLNSGSLEKKIGQFIGMSTLKGGAADQMIRDQPGLTSGWSTNLNLQGLNFNGSGGGFVPGGGDGGGGGGMGARFSGGASSSSGVASILQKYAGGRTAASPKSASGLESKIGAALAAAAAAGFSGDELITLVSLAGRESRFQPEAYNGNLATKDNSYGLWQINTLGGMWDAMKGPLGLTSKDQLKDPMNNARAARFLFDQNPIPFFAWGPYKSESPLHGGAENWVPAVYSVAQQQGYIGDPGMAYEAMGGGRAPQAPVNFYNQFNIQSGGMGGSGVDVGRLVPMMADRLEQTMNQRLAARR